MKVGTRLRFFSNRVFGVWIDGTIQAISPKYITIRAYYQGIEWSEKVSPQTEFYYPHDHPQAGEVMTDTKANTVTNQ